jgi:hypothetical protein
MSNDCQECLTIGLPVALSVEIVSVGAHLGLTIGRRLALAFRRTCEDRGRRAQIADLPAICSPASASTSARAFASNFAWRAFSAANHSGDRIFEVSRRVASRTSRSHTRVRLSGSAHSTASIVFLDAAANELTLTVAGERDDPVTRLPLPWHALGATTHADASTIPRACRAAGLFAGTGTLLVSRST